MTTENTTHYTALIGDGTHKLFPNEPEALQWLHTNIHPTQWNTYTTQTWTYTNGVRAH